MFKKNNFPINNILNHLDQKQTFIFLENSRHDQENYLSYIFTDPIKIIQTRDYRKIKSCFKQIELAQSKGYYVSGFISYEAGYMISDKFKNTNTQNPNYPLVWLGVFKNPLIFDHQQDKFINNRFLPLSNTPESSNKNYQLKNLKLAISRADYIQNIKKIKKLIASGDTYQVNYTTKYKFDFQGSSTALYRKIRNNQSISYGAFIKSPEFDILSFSPELFFCLNSNKLMVKPMKGTAARGINLQENKQNKKNLAADIKNRAENLMIVDLLRNDLGKISQTASVRVSKMFNVETYKTLLQMTSTITSKLKNHTSLFELFFSLFPSGSITGAPKIRTMEIINSLEKEPRGVYTGAIGFFAPQNKAIFNVAIRTITIKNNQGQMGIGGGITYSSDPREEYAECKLKAKFLTMPDFKLIETMLWNKKQGFYLLDNHLNRLNQSSKFFNYPYSKAAIIKQLKHLTLSLNTDYNYKVRLLLDTSGKITLEPSFSLKQKTASTQKIRLSKKQTNSQNIFLYHKTTNRKLYKSEYKKHKNLGFFDVIFRNQKNQITEGAISNIFIKKNGVYYTPLIKCGILPGVFRDYFISKHIRNVEEKILYLADLKTADSIYCTNAVQGLVKVTL
ncbi:MAG: aminodeoxychorismate synthase component I [Candidatus Omnitrophica bacterium]|nr:aminodeoxychorismate synthase component I [Candidatus Omnitrophota bacterium]